MQCSSQGGAWAHRPNRPQLVASVGEDGGRTAVALHRTNERCGNAGPEGASLPVSRNIPEQ
eukprot:1917316-Alexandrium_andersonii.AAC.1